MVLFSIRYSFTPSDFFWAQYGRGCIEAQQVIYCLFELYFFTLAEDRHQLIHLLVLEAHSRIKWEYSLQLALTDCGLRRSRYVTYHADSQVHAVYIGFATRTERYPAIIYMSITGQSSLPCIWQGSLAAHCQSVHSRRHSQHSGALYKQMCFLRVSASWLPRICNLA